MTRTNLQRAAYFAGVYALLAAAIGMPLLALVLLWHRGLSIALLPVGIAEVTVLFAFRKIAPPAVADSTNHANLLWRRVIFLGALALALGLAVFAACYPPRA